MKTFIKTAMVLLIFATALCTDTIYTDATPVRLRRSDSLHYVVWRLEDTECLNGDCPDSATLIAWGCQPEAAGTWISSYLPMDTLGEFADAEFVVLIRWGDLNMDAQFNVADLTLMIDVLFMGGEIP